MRSSGGVVTLPEAAAHPAWALLSGPAAGAVGAAYVARRAGFADAIAFDMGGTSTDVCAIVGGEATRESQRVVGGFPIRLPTLAIHTVGAGGGSLVWRDEGGALRVGPESAGALPGPACYGRGGERATVTDANLLLGRLPATLPGGIELDTDAATRALGDIDPAAVVAVVDAEMLGALRVVSVEQGHDPRDFALVAFGGAGPLHACALADELGMRTVLVPAAAGVLSALGLAAMRRASRHRAQRRRRRSRRPASCRTRARPTCATPGSRSSSRCRSGRRWPSAFTLRTSRATATRTAPCRSSSSPCARPRPDRARRSSCAGLR